MSQITENDHNIYVNDTRQTSCVHYCITIIVLIRPAACIANGQLTVCKRYFFITICSRARIGYSDFWGHLGCVDMLGSLSPVHQCRLCCKLSSRRRALFLPDETDPVTAQHLTVSAAEMKIAYQQQ